MQQKKNKWKRKECKMQSVSDGSDVVVAALHTNDKKYAHGYRRLYIVG